MSAQTIEAPAPEQERSRVTAVIVNWNGAEDTMACVDALQRVHRPACDLAIVVVDNASSDGSPAAIPAFLERQGYATAPLVPPLGQAGRVASVTRSVGPRRDVPEIMLVAAADNLGFAGGNNLGVELSRAEWETDYFWFLNSDTEVDPHALAPLLDKMRRHPEIGICGSALLHSSDRKTVQAYGGARYSLRTGRAWSAGEGSTYDAGVPDEWAERRINYVAGAAMFVRAELLATVGLMCEDYFLYNEEIDLSVRARGKFVLGVATNSVVYHRVGATIGTEGASRPASKLSTFYQTRSKLLFALRHSVRFVPTVWLTLLARGVKCLLSPPRRGEARIIFEVLAGRRSADPRWFSERRLASEPIPHAATSE